MNVKQPLACKICIFAGYFNSYFHFIVIDHEKTASSCYNYIAFGQIKLPKSSANAQCTV